MIQINLDKLDILDIIYALTEAADGAYDDDCPYTAAQYRKLANVLRQQLPLGTRLNGEAVR